MFYAKSEPQETLKEHTDELVKQIKYLKKIMGYKTLGMLCKIRK